MIQRYLIEMDVVSLFICIFLFNLIGNRFVFFFTCLVFFYFLFSVCHLVTSFQSERVLHHRRCPLLHFSKVEFGCRGRS